MWSSSPSSNHNNKHHRRGRSQQSHIFTTRASTRSSNGSSQSTTSSDLSHPAGRMDPEVILVDSVVCTLCNHLVAKEDRKAHSMTFHQASFAIASSEYRSHYMPASVPGERDTVASTCYPDSGSRSNQPQPANKASDNDAGTRSPRRHRPRAVSNADVIAVRSSYEETLAIWRAPRPSTQPPDYYSLAGYNPPVAQRPTPSTLNESALTQHNRLYEPMLRHSRVGLLPNSQYQPPPQYSSGGDSPPQSQHVHATATMPRRERSEHDQRVTAVVARVDAAAQVHHGRSAHHRQSDPIPIPGMHDSFQETFFGRNLHQ